MSAGARPRAIVMDASDGGLVIARHLRRRGVPVTVLARPYYAWTTRTRGVDGRIMPGLEERDAWLATLDELARGGDGVLVPISDRACEFLCREREHIAPSLRSFEGPDSMHLALMDKGSLYRLAGQAGLRVPVSEVVEDRATLREVAARISYPCLLKAALSHRYRSVLGDRRVRLVPDADALVEAAGEAIDLGLQVLVGEHVPGPETNLEGAVTLRREDGSLALAYSRRKLRQHPPYYGAGAVMEAYRSPEVVAFARRLLDSVGFVGFSSLEAKRHAETGELVLMEINVRIPQNFGLSMACGVDGPWRVYATLAGLPLGEQPEPRYGAKTIIASLEVHAAAEYVRAGDLTLRDVVRSYRGTRDVSGLSLRDPAPLAAFLGGQARRGLRRAQGALRSRGDAEPAARAA